MDETPDQLVRAARDGDAAAWRRLIESYTPRVYGLLVRQCGDRELAEELTQATFVQIVEKLANYDEQGKFDAWLFRIAINRLRDEMRRRKRQAGTTDFDAAGGVERLGRPYTSAGLADGSGGAGSMGQTPPAALAQAERVGELLAAIGRLPEADQQVLYMRYTADMSYQQIADALRQPLGTVLARGHRAIKKLRELLDDSEAA